MTRRTTEAARRTRRGLVVAAAMIGFGVGLPTAAFGADEPAKIVTPVAPDVHAIEECGSYGFLGMIGTQGIAYELTVGDGREGPWEVRASAAPGYRLAPGAVDRWDGDLGTYQDCDAPSDTDGATASSAPQSGAQSKTEGDAQDAIADVLYSERGEQALNVIAVGFGVIALVCGVYLVLVERRRRWRATDQAR